MTPATLLPPNAVAALVAGGTQRHLMTLVPGADPTVGPALSVQTVNGSDHERNARVTVDTIDDLRAGDVVLAQCRARCTESMTGEGQIGFAFEYDDGTAADELRVGVGGEWSEFSLPFRINRDAPAGAARVCFRLGHDRQTVEIADVRATNLGDAAVVDELPRTRLTYVGREADAEWRAVAAERIERLRKGDLLVRVTDADGMPIRGARVEVEQRRLAFGVGSAVDARLLMGESADSERYREVVGSLFTQAVFENDMKWPAVYAGVPAVVDAALGWLHGRGIAVRGHNLVWPSWRWLPKELQAFKDQPDELRRRTLAHIRNTAAHFAGRLTQWDVVNEPFSEHDLIDLLGGPGVMVDWFRAARAADPSAALYLNDYGIFDSGRGANVHQDHFFETLRLLIDGGAPLDGVGIQSHFSSDLPSVEQLWRTLDRFARFGLPIESTEFSLNFDDEQLQADYLRDYLTALFAHERVNGVMLWGFWAGRHWRPAAGLWDRQWREKPGVAVLRTLLGETWRTRATIEADAEGVARVRAFCGEYDVRAVVGGRAGAARVTLGRYGADVSIRMSEEGRSA